MNNDNDHKAMTREYESPLFDHGFDIFNNYIESAIRIKTKHKPDEEEANDS